MNIKKFSIYAAVLAIALWILLGARIGVGEYSRSDDGKYEASILVGQRGLLGLFNDFVEFKVVDVSNNKVIWLALFYPSAKVDSHNIGDRTRKNIHWDGVTVKFNNPAGTDLELKL